MITHRAVLNVILLAAGILPGVASELDKATATNAVRSVLAAVNSALGRSDGKAFAELFATDGELRIGGRILAVGRKAIAEQIGKPGIWTEVTPPRLEKDSIRFLSPEIAVVDAGITRYGSLTIKESVPVTILLTRHGGHWLVVSMRVVPGVHLADCLRTSISCRTRVVRSRRRGPHTS